MESFTRALVINPRKAEAYSRRARVYERLGLPEEADRRRMHRLGRGS
jgi:Flp pilus assembly protein TadD